MLKQCLAEVADAQNSKPSSATPATPERPQPHAPKHATAAPSPSADALDLQPSRPDTPARSPSVKPPSKSPGYADKQLTPDGDVLVPSPQPCSAQRVVCMPEWPSECCAADAESAPCTPSSASPASANGVRPPASGPSRPPGLRPLAADDCERTKEVSAPRDVKRSLFAHPELDGSRATPQQETVSGLQAPASPVSLRELAGERLFAAPWHSSPFGAVGSVTPGVAPSLR